MRRVVVTGVGAVTPLGNTFRESWRNLVAGVSGITKITRFDVSDIPYRYAGQVMLKDVNGERTVRRYDPFIRFALLAAREAVADAGIGDGMPGEKVKSVGVHLGSSRAGISTLERAMQKRVEKLSARRCSSRLVSPFLMPGTTTSMAASAIAQEYGFQGDCMGLSNACASGIAAVGSAYRLIRSGYADMIVAGGADAPVCRLCLEGYGSMGALSKRQGKDASRPFDLERDGFVLSEGACLLVLEEYASARGRGAKIYGEIAGFGNTMDAYHPARPSPGGEAAAMRQALAEAAVAPAAIGCISAHATATRLGDRAEAAALGEVFGESIARIPVYALKAMTGHMLAASGALEAAAALSAMTEGVLLPAPHLRMRDPDCALRISGMSEPADVGSALVNSFGFGGANAVLVLKKSGDR